MRAIVVILCLSFLFVGCCKLSDTPSVFTDFAMDTVVELSLWQDGTVSELCFDEVKRIEKKFSAFDINSEIYKINSNSGSKVKVSSECIELIKTSLQYNKITKKAFDVTKQKGEIIIHGDTVTVPEGVSIDLGGIAKGYAIDRVVSVLEENDIHTAMVNVGGDLFLLGMPKDKTAWSIGVQDPTESDKLIGILELNSNVGVATSGNYERPGHIINPETQRPASGILSVTIIASSSTYADALATGVYVLGLKQGMNLIESLEEVEGVLIYKENDTLEISVSKALKKCFKRI